MHRHLRQMQHCSASFDEEVARCSPPHEDLSAATWDVSAKASGRGSVVAVVGGPSLAAFELVVPLPVQPAVCACQGTSDEPEQRRLASLLDPQERWGLRTARWRTTGRTWLRVSQRETRSQSPSQMRQQMCDDQSQSHPGCSMACSKSQSALRIRGGCQCIACQ
jgi:hypothetical protein